MTTKTDNRYTVAREYDGHVLPRYVVRFCGRFISSHPTEDAANAARNASATARAARPYDAFFIGYCEALQFTDTGDDEGQPAPDAPLSDELRDAIAHDCEAFQRDNAALLAVAYANGYTADQAGRDFHFTRNGHGAGYWDRAELKGQYLTPRVPDNPDIGVLLTTAAHNAGALETYAGDDGRIYG